MKKMGQQGYYLYPQVLMVSYEEHESIHSLTNLMTSKRTKRNIDTESSVSYNKLKCEICLTYKIDVTFYKMWALVLLRKLCTQVEWNLPYMSHTI